LTGGTDRPIGDRPAQVVFALLVLACFAAFFLTQRLKHTPTAVQAFKLTPTFSPTAPGHRRQERISFKLAAADEVTVTIIDAGGDVVATLTRDRSVPRYKPLSLRWNGRMGTASRYTVLVEGTKSHTVLVPQNEGGLAPAGEYRVQVSLRKQGRTVRSPRSFSLVG
jgi:hypothetical protein